MTGGTAPFYSKINVHPLLQFIPLDPLQDVPDVGGFRLLPFPANQLLLNHCNGRIFAGGGGSFKENFPLC